MQQNLPNMLEEFCDTYIKKTDTVKRLKNRSIQTPMNDKYT